MGEIIMFPKEKRDIAWFRDKKLDIVRFPGEEQTPYRRKKPPQPREAFPKYLPRDQVVLLRRVVREHGEDHLRRHLCTGVREWLCIDILTCSGLRAFEVVNLRVVDCQVGHGHLALFVRAGKWGKERTVQIPLLLRNHIRQYLAWKAERGEPMGEEDHLILGKQGAWTSQVPSQITRKWLKLLGLYERGKAAHSLRHSYATALYKKERDLRCVQKQLGHSSPTTTAVYADITDEDIQEQVKGLWGRRLR